MSRSKFAFLTLSFILLPFTLTMSPHFRDDLVKNLTNKYCPFYGFFGPMCPNSKVTESLNPVRIIGGLGYNQATRNLRWPIYVARDSKIQTLKSIEKQKFSNLEEYLKYMACANDLKFDIARCRGGLYVGTDEYIETLINTFTDYHQNMIISQSYYKMFETQNTVMAPEFLSFLLALPPIYDPSNRTVVQMYRALFDEFGTHVTDHMYFGGIIFVMADLKVCLADGGYIENELEYFLTNDFNPNHCYSALPAQYCKYRLIKTYEAAGGAPDIDLRTNPQKLISSMESNPVVTDFDAIPLWKVVPPEYTSAVHQAYLDYIAAYEKTRNDWINRAETGKQQRWLGPQSITLYHGNTEQDGIPTIIDTNAPNINTGRWMYVPRFALERWNLVLSAGQSTLFCTYINFQGQGIKYYVDRGLNGYISIDLVIGSERSQGSENPFDCYKDVTWWHFNAQKTLVSQNVVNGIDIEGDAPMIVHLRNQTSDGYCVNRREMELRGTGKYTFFVACIDILSYIVSSPAQHNMQHYDVATACPGF